MTNKVFSMQRGLLPSAILLCLVGLSAISPKLVWAQDAPQTDPAPATTDEVTPTPTAPAAPANPSVTPGTTNQVSPPKTTETAPAPTAAPATEGTPPATPAEVAPVPTYPAPAGESETAPPTTINEDPVQPPIRALW
jgi:hypothetical protein